MNIQNAYTYNHKYRVDPDILSTLGVNKDGDVVSASAWTSLWQLVLAQTNHFDDTFTDMCTTMQAVISDIRNAAVDVEDAASAANTSATTASNAASAANTSATTASNAAATATNAANTATQKAAAILQHMYHIGYNAPTNADVTIWIEPGATQYYNLTDADKINIVQMCGIVQAADTLTTPATVPYSNGGKLLNAAIIGKSIQDGTPTPTTPIAIQNVGNTLTLKSGVSADDTNATIYTIPLTDINGTSHIMRQFDEVKKHDDGKWYFDCNSAAYIFNGTETWNNGATDSHIKTTSLTKIAKYVLGQGQGLSNRYIYSATNIIGKFYYFKSGSNLICAFYNPTEQTSNEWKTQLAEWNTNGNPLTVEYQTDTTTSYELSASTSAILDSITIQKGNANIYFTNTVTPTMTADYPLDMKLYTDNKMSALEARLTALENIQ